MAGAVKFVDAASADQAQAEFGDALKKDPYSLSLLVDTPHGTRRAGFGEWLARDHNGDVCVVEAIH